MSKEDVEEVDEAEELEEAADPQPEAAPVVQPERKRRGRPPKVDTSNVNVPVPAQEVREALGMGAARKPEAEPAGTAPEEFVKALANPKNIYIIKRTAPAEIDGKPSRGEVDRGECPVTLQEIHDSISSRFGGRRYLIRVLDSASNQLVTAERIEIDVEPKSLNSEGIDPDTYRQLMGMSNAKEEEESPTEEISKSLRRQTAAMTAKAELENAKRLLAEVTSKPGEAKGDVMAQVMAVLERQRAEDRYQRQIEMLTRKVEELSRPKDDDGIGGGMKMMLKLIEQQQAQTAALIQGMKDQQIAALTAEVKALANRPSKDSNDLLTQVTALKKLGSVLGWTGADDDDDDGDDDKEWYEVLVSKHIPRIIDMIESRRKTGDPAPTKAEVVAELRRDAELQRVADAAVDEAFRAKAAGRPTIPALPAPAPTAPRASAQVSIPEPTVPPAAATPSPAVPIVAAPPAPAPTPQPVLPELPTLEDEIKMRAARFLYVLEREMTVRPKEYEWTAIAWAALPEDFLDLLIAAPDSVAAIAAFKDVVKPEALSELSEKAANPKIATWMARGLTELKEWTAQQAADPSFDPLNVDDDEDETEPEIGG